MNECILVIEDEAKMARMLELELTHEGYAVDKAFDGITGLQEAEKGGHDLILLDLMLPGLSGMEVLRRLRKISGVPVILLTARDEVMDKVSGLDQGADDYITKPFAIEELLARIRNCLRKKAGQTEQTLTASGLTLSPERHQVKYGDTVIELTLREFELLQYLMENKGRVLSRESLLTNVWGYDFQGETNAVDVYISFLRDKIDQQFGIKLINTVRGVGYQISDDG
jgi:DNA-binding response OmpR family regulator